MSLYDYQNNRITYTQLKKPERKGYKHGKSQGEWITWESRQNTTPDRFIHKSYYLAGLGFQNTQKMLLQIVDQKVKSRRSNLSITIKKSGIPYDMVGIGVVGRHLPKKGVGYATGLHKGANPVILWQIANTGTWCMATGYGVAEGVEVSVKKRAEWKLRSGIMIGWIHWLGKGVYPGLHNGHRNVSFSKQLINKECEWKWENVGLEIWGYTDQYAMTKKGMELGGVKWTPFTNMNGNLKVGGLSVIENSLPTLAVNGKWHKWALDQINKGRSLMMVKDDKLTYQQGGFTHVLGEDEYEELKKDIVMLRRHTDTGTIFEAET